MPGMHVQLLAPVTQDRPANLMQISCSTALSELDTEHITRIDAYNDVQTRKLSL